jgi:hypothetical protein|tara:strand:- start:2437 stop:2907 length:471 start_codon:yes stop_codon:yes gene_type:complete
MIHAQNTRILQLVQPDEQSASTANAVEIDCQDASYCTVIVMLKDCHAALSVCSLTEGDTTGAVTDAIAAATLGNSACLDVAGSAVPLSDMNDNDALVFHVNMVGRKRFLKLNATTASGGTTDFTAIAILSRKDENAGKLNSDFITASTGTAKAIVI